jgi:hypothetical protein
MQVAYERVQSMRRAREIGLTYKQIGARFGVCAQRAYQLVATSRRYNTPPVTIFYGTPAGVAATVFDELKSIEKRCYRDGDQWRMFSR